MNYPRTVLLMALAWVACPADAAVCRIALEANDLMQYNKHRLEVSPDCSDVEVTLTHVGKQPAHIMGHNWVLVRSSDVSAVSAAGQNAGRSHNYQQPGDPRIVAATPLVGGGEAATISFSTAGLRFGEAYTFFCSTPGHGTMMRGAFVFGDPSTRQVAATSAAK